jgi:hypothetical protein
MKLLYFIQTEEYNIDIVKWKSLQYNNTVLCEYVHGKGL